MTFNTDEKAPHLTSASLPSDIPCPCGNKATLGDCCGPLLAGSLAASTAEALMRSRYTAYALKDASYLNATHHPSTRDETLKASLESSFQNCEWTGLKITGRSAGSPLDDAGTVRFEATFVQKAKPYILKELSRFIKEDGRWLYKDGDGGIDAIKIALPGRNDPCWCGNGKKFKKCHGA